MTIFTLNFKGCVPIYHYIVQDNQTLGYITLRFVTCHALAPIGLAI